MSKWLCSRVSARLLRKFVLIINGVHLCWLAIDGLFMSNSVIHEMLEGDL